MRQALDKERIRDLYRRYELTDLAWSEWMTAYEADLRWAQETSVEALHTPEAQTRLWKLRGLGSAGPSESIDISAATVDPELVKALVQLRRRSFDPAPSRRAQELQLAYDQVVARLEIALDGGSIPRVRLQRLLHGLRPGDMICAFNQKSLYTIRDFLVGKRGLGVIENHVLARARLRDALGPEGDDLAEHVRRSTFCWWLYENAESIAAGADPSPPVAVQTEQPKVTVDPDPDPVVELLEPWPVSRQHRSVQVYKGGLTTLRVVLRECLEPQTIDLLAGGLQDELELEVLRPRYLLALLRDLRRLGLIVKQGEDYLTTESGEAVLDHGGEEILAMTLVQRLRGFAWTLRALHDGASNRAAVADALVFFAPDGVAIHMAQRHLWWGHVSGVVERVDSMARALTTKGRALHARLPATLERPAAEASDEAELLEEEEGSTSVAPGIAEPGLKQLHERFQALAAKEGLVFSFEQVLALHTAWRFGARHAGEHRPPKRFAILSGLSGTGKTQLLVQYARATCELMNLDPEKHVLLAPVRPDWRDPTGLLGYLNALHAEPTFQAEPALRLVIRASRNPELPYFLLLDEMNLARVERYFAPFLSAMESGQRLDLHAHDEPLDGVPPWVRWPSNLRIGGTVNMDETTHPFSDKVLDRAFTLEFWDVDLERYFAHRPGRTEADVPVQEALLAFQDRLRPIRRHVGYRTAGEVLAWIAEAREGWHEELPLAPLLDQALFSKVLPRLRGAETRSLHDALDGLLKESRSRGLRTCAEKLEQMKARLDDTGVTGFWS